MSRDRRWAAFFLATGILASSQAVGHAQEWARNAIWYQIFPERFRNSDPTNDPVLESLDSAKWVPPSWEINRWTGGWYTREGWERAKSEQFYDTVFSRRYGGDLQGVIDKLDYLRDLNINAIYFNPVFHAPSMHKYDSASMHHIDPYFGSDPKGDLAIMETETADPQTWQWTAADKLFLKLLKEARARGIRVIIDGVFNHTGQKFFAFENLRKMQERSPYKDWYVVKSFDKPDTEENEFKFSGWWGFDSLPEFATTPEGSNLHPGPKAYVFAITRRWMDPDGDGDPRDGIDGWRLDVADELPPLFWSQWNRLVKSINPDAVTFAETWHEAGEFIRKSEFSGAMNYFAFAIPTKGFLVDGTFPPSKFGKALDERRAKLPGTSAPLMMNMMDSHDTERIASTVVNRNIAGNYENKDWFDYDNGNKVSPRSSPAYRIRKPDDEDRAIQRLVGLFQVCYVGAPMLYYGTEAGMWGADDPDNRQPMTWDDMTFAGETEDPRGASRVPDSVEYDKPLADYYRALFKLRKDHRALRYGTFATVLADDAKMLYAFARDHRSEKLLVVLNRSEKEQTAEIAGAVEAPAILASSSGRAEDAVVEATPKGIQVKLPAFTGAVIKVR